MTDLRFDAWLEDLQRRHLTELEFSEVARALKALSSRYVQRRAQLSERTALDTAGKRAAYALYYSLLHFLTVRQVVSELPRPANGLTLIDLGCGAGACGAAWGSLVAREVIGIDSHPWAIAEANWTYRVLGLQGRAHRLDLSRVRLDPAPGLGILAAYTINELPADLRSAWLTKLLDARARGAAVLIIEPIARRMAPWWGEWEQRFLAAGGRSDEWRFDAPLPARQRELARSAGLSPRELRARSLFAG